MAAHIGVEVADGLSAVFPLMGYADPHTAGRLGLGLNTSLPVGESLPLMIRGSDRAAHRAKRGAASKGRRWSLDVTAPIHGSAGEEGGG
jgi:hypothetical protein